MVRLCQEESNMTDHNIDTVGQNIHPLITLNATFENSVMFHPKFNTILMKSKFKFHISKFPPGKGGW